MKPKMEIYYFEMPTPSAYLDQEGLPKIGGTPGFVQIRLKHNHGIWESGATLRAAIRSLLRSCKIAELPFHIEDYEVIFLDTMRCNVFHADGREILPTPAALNERRSA
jgi:hypothetical protein